MEDYAAKMLLKTDAALREYVTGHIQYREAAVLAALDELRRRGQPAPEEAALRPSLETGAAAQRIMEDAAEAARQEAVRPAAAVAAAVADESSPALYSPVTIVLFSILPVPVFSMIAGGILMCMNLYRIGRKRAMLGLIAFIIVYFYVGSAIFSWAFLHGLNVVWGVMAFNVPAALTYILWFWPRYVGKSTFRSRSIFMPILVFAFIIWGLEKLTPYVMQHQPKEVQQQLKRMMPKQQQD